MVNSGDYVDFREIEAVDVKQGTYEYLFKEWRDRFPEYTDEEITRRLKAIKDGDLTQLPEQSLLKEAFERNKIVINRIIKK